MAVEKLIFEKIIYAKSYKTTKEQILDVLKIEVETILRNHPDLEFKKIEKPIHNDDQSITYPLLFQKKNNQHVV